LNNVIVDTHLSRILCWQCWLSPVRLFWLLMKAMILNYRHLILTMVA